MAICRFYTKWLKMLWQLETAILGKPGIVPGIKTARLQTAFLVPLVTSFVAILCIWVAVLYVHERREVVLETEREHALMQRMYRDDIEHDAYMLNAVMEVIQRDATLRSALARRDRESLLQLSSPVYQMLRRKFGITHIYFSTPKRKIILRVHQPEHYGDVIDRFTSMEAERTGTTSYGLELGPLGTFGLRLVAPWYENKRLLGYVELGMEIDHVVHTVQAFMGTSVFVLISKQHLNREEWMAGMRMLGRPPEWDRFPDEVLVSQVMETIPPELAAPPADRPPAKDVVSELNQMITDYKAVYIPLADAGGHVVGRMVALVNVSKSHASLRKALFNGVAIGVLIVTLVVWIFYRLARRVGRHIERDEEVMRRLATHDGLTGLYNHRMFYALLEEELLRTKRFNRPLSLLMIDIDHFKGVNDTHGHQAGDTILHDLSELLSREARGVDRVCRYGGEEITVMLPETDVDAASVIAERLRAAVEAQSFDIDQGNTLRITVSIGVATWPNHANNVQALVAAADAALYAAKQGGRNRMTRYEAGMKQGGPKDEV